MADLHDDDALLVRHSRKRARLGTARHAGIALAALCSAAVLVIMGRGASPHVPLAEPTATAVDVITTSTRNSSLDLRLSNEYPAISSLYPWRIVEPHRTTTLMAVSGLDQHFVTVNTSHPFSNHRCSQPRLSEAFRLVLSTQ